MVAANYEIRIKGSLSDSLLPAFEGMAVTTESVETIVYGPLADQEAIHQLMIRLESLGLEVVEFRRLPAEVAFDVSGDLIRDDQAEMVRLMAQP